MQLRLLYSILNLGCKDHSRVSLGFGNGLSRGNPDLGVSGQRLSEDGETVLIEGDPLDVRIATLFPCIRGSHTVISDPCLGAVRGRKEGTVPHTVDLIGGRENRRNI